MLIPNAKSRPNFHALTSFWDGTETFPVISLGVETVRVFFYAALDFSGSSNHMKYSQVLIQSELQVYIIQV